MAAEDFTTWSEESDPGDDFTVTSTKIDATSLNRNSDSWYADDKGVDHFDGDFVHLVEAYHGSSYNAGLEYHFWGLANSADSSNDIDSASGDMLFAEFLDVGGTIRVYAVEIDGGAFYTGASFNISAATLYYFEIERDESVGTYGTFYVRCYSDASRETLVGTSSVTLHSSKKDYRYIYALQTKNEGNNEYFYGYTQNLDLQESAAQAVTGNTISTGASLFSPETIQNVATNTISSGSTLYASVVIGPPQDVVGVSISSGLAVYSPDAAFGVSGNHISSGASLYSGILTQNVVTNVITSGVSLYASTISPDQEVSSIAIDSGSAVYALEAAFSIAGTHISSTEVLYTHGVDQGVQVVVAGHASSVATTYSPGTIQAITDLGLMGISDIPMISQPKENSALGEFLPSSSVLYSASVSPGPVAVTTDHISSSAELYPIDITINSQHISSGSSLYAAGVDSVYDVNGAYIDSGVVLYKPTIAGGEPGGEENNIIFHVVAAMRSIRGRLL